MNFLDSEFFRNNKGQKSMGRLLPFMAYPPATIVLLWVHTAEALGIYLSAFVVHYGISKCVDAYSNQGQK